MSQNNSNNSSSTVSCTINPSSPVKPNEASGNMAACEGETIEVTMGMFFDGTGNNKENTDYSRKLGKKSGSFYNSYSNIARAWAYYRGELNGQVLEDNTNIVGNQDDGGNFNVYVEGIGTNNGAVDDDWFGQGGGNHPRSGIKERVRLGTKKAAKAIMDYKKVKEIINTVHKIEVTFDVFGFSRGAAAARHFIHLNAEEEHDETFSSYLEYNINTLFEQERKIEITIKWRFAGLYETVSSHGLFHRDDDAELGLTAISNVDYVVQIVAEDEYRENFTLTNIKSAPNTKIIRLPGVHSDIGGGYSEKYKSGTEEKDYILYKIRYDYTPANSRSKAEQKMIKVKKWFLDNGWYKESGNNDDELKIKTTGFFDGYVKLIGTRKNIKNTYSYIPLQIMTLLAIEKGLYFDGNRSKGSKTKLFDEYKVYNDPILNKIFRGFKVNLNVLSSTELQEFRYKYLHWSSRYNGIGVDPNLNNNLASHPKFERPKTIEG